MKSVWSLFSTPLLPADYLALVRPHAKQARIEAVLDEAPGVRTLVLRPGRTFRPHVPGQHVRVGLAIDGRLAARTYSISSVPDARRIAITVKAQGRVSNALCASEPGAFVTLGAAEGAFTFTGGKALFVTGGSGITPIASMVRTFARAEMPDVVHVHFARTADDVIFGEELRAIALAHPRYRLIVITTADTPRRLDLAYLDELVGDRGERTTYACGPQSLLDALAGVPDLRVERFRTALAPMPANARGGLVTFGRSSFIVRGDARTPLLHVAEAAGVRAPSGCRRGICHTCDTTMVSGCVRDLRTGQTIDEPGARIQLCVCAAAGDVDLAL